MSGVGNHLIVGHFHISGESDKYAPLQVTEAGYSFHSIFLSYQHVNEVKYYC